MTTPQINSGTISTIDATFPIAGQDNSSSGFRNNYTQIINNLQFAANDIQGLWANVDSLNSNSSSTANIVANVTALQSNVTILQGNVVTLNGDIVAINGNVTALSANVMLTNATNNLHGNVISGPTKSLSTVAVSGNTSTTLDYSVADFYRITITSGNLTLSVANWPAAGVYATMGALISMNNGYTITFPGNVVLGGNATVSNVAGVQSRVGSVLTSVQDNTYWFEFASVNGGINVYVSEKSVTY